MMHIQDNIVAIVPAAGIGRRMGSDIPKQYLHINGQAILGHTLDTLLSHKAVTSVLVATHINDIWFHCLPQANHPKLKCVLGGDERSDSVLACLNEVVSHCWVLVHDAARPCLTHGDIDKLIASRTRFPQGAILASQVRDTMKRGNPDGTINHTVSRELLWHALTPQFFPAQLLKRHLVEALAAGAVITDEASAMEWAGISPGLVSGRVDNIKVTHPDDLQLAQMFINNRVVK